MVDINTFAYEFSVKEILKIYQKLKQDESIDIKSECDKGTLKVEKKVCWCKANCGEILRLYMVNPDRSKMYLQNKITFSVEVDTLTTMEAKNLSCDLCPWYNFGNTFVVSNLKKKEDKFLTITVTKSNEIQTTEKCKD